MAARGSCLTRSDVWMFAGLHMCYKLVSSASGMFYVCGNRTLLAPMYPASMLHGTATLQPTNTVCSTPGLPCWDCSTLSVAATMVCESTKRFFHGTPCCTVMLRNDVLGSQTQQEGARVRHPHNNTACNYCCPRADVGPCTLTPIHIPQYRLPAFGPSCPKPSQTYSCTQTQVPTACLVVTGISPPTCMTTQC
jgi:hypothetical protein